MKEGERYQNNKGLWFEITNYHSSRKVEIEFIQSKYRTTAQASNIRRGRVEDRSIQHVANGVRFKNNVGDSCLVLDYKDSKNVLVRFTSTKTVKSFRLDALKSGQFEDPCKPTVCGVGFIGIGNYDSGRKNGFRGVYKRWTGIINRCYNDKHDQYPRYGGKGVRVCQSWLNYQNFAHWLTIAILDRGKTLDDLHLFQIDKDEKSIGTPVYSPETCSLVTTKEHAKITHDQKVYTFVKDSKMEKLTISEMNKKYDFKSKSKLYSLRDGKIKTYLGWKILGQS